MVIIYISDVKIAIPHDNYCNNLHFSHHGKDKCRKAWLNAKDILCRIAEPSPTGKSRRNYNLNDSDAVAIQEAFNKRK